MSKIRIALFVLLLVSCSYLFAQETGEKPDIKLEQVIAVVNGEPITVAEFKAEYAQLTAEQKKNFTEASREVLLTNIVDRKLLLQQAENIGLDTLEIIEKRLQQVKENILADAVLNLVVQQQGLSVTDERLEQYYTENESLFIIPTRIRLSQIFMDNKAKADEVVSKLKSGSNFSDLAREYSMGKEAEAGGDLGYFTEAQLNPEIAKVVFKLQIGQNSGVINFRDNFHVFKVTDKIEPRKQAFDEVKDQLKQRVMQQLRSSTMQNYQTQLRKNAEITINNPTLYSVPLE
ncbi:peptidyl-prolyl cis-trans isomerase [bacterium]|nr:peptidyl-prolyl cis-trans isomerase [bacterium]